MRIARGCTAALLAAFTSGCVSLDGDGEAGGPKYGVAPVADAGDDGLGRLYRTYALDGTQSVDPEGRELAYAWTLFTAPDGSAATLTSSAAATAYFVPDLEGTYLFGLTVDDGKHASAPDLVEVDVRLRVGVFADPHLRGPLAGLLDDHGVIADDWTATPDSIVLAAEGPWVLFADARNHQWTLIAYDTTIDQTFVIAFGEIDLASVRMDGNHAVWGETRYDRYDLFASYLSSGGSTQLTDDAAVETLTSLSNGIAVWHVEATPGGPRDVMGWDLEGGGPFDIADSGADEHDGVNDGEKVVFTVSVAGNPDLARLYDAADDSTLTLASNGAAAAGVSDGDALVWVGSTLYAQEIATFARAQVTSNGSAQVVDVDGDYALYRDGSSLTAWRFSTGANVAVATTSSPYADLSSGSVVYVGDDGDVYLKTLPAGTATAVTATAASEGPVALSGDGHFAWTVEGTRGLDVRGSSDGGASSDVLSSGKPYLDEALDEYDVLLIAGAGLDTEYGAGVVEAADANGLPMLGADVGGYGLAERLQEDGQYGLTIGEATDCGPLRIVVPVHPVFDGFPVGDVLTFDREIPGLAPGTEDARYFEATGTGTLPATFDALTTFQGLTCAAANGKAAIVTFETASGTPVVLDGGAPAAHAYAFWSEDRMRVLLAELRWLASHSAP